MPQAAADLLTYYNVIFSTDTNPDDHLSDFILDLFSGEFKRNEFNCCLKQDYYLVPTRMDTLIPAGTNVKIFGQLPNRRWRCLVELDDLITVMNELVKNLETDKEADEANIKKTSTVFHNKLNNLPNYPLIGSLPTSVLDVDLNPIKETLKNEEILSDVNNESVFERSTSIHMPYSVHKRKSSRLTPVKDWGPQFPVKERVDGESDTTDGNTSTKDDIISVNEKKGDNASDTTSLAEISQTDDDIIFDNNESDSEDYLLDNTSGFMRSDGSSFHISKKLRQKGISIRVGSSSSEGKN